MDIDAAVVKRADLRVGDAEPVESGRACRSNAPASRADAVRKILERTYEHGGRLAVLGWTKHQQPRHPLYVRADTKPTYLVRQEVN